MNLMATRSLEQRRNVLLRDAAQIQAEINAAKGRKLLKCNHCSKRTPVRLTTYVQCYWYESPYSCTGGDRWHEGEGRFVCAKCGYENRLIYRPEIVALKRFFGRHEDHYKDQMKIGGKWRSIARRSWVN